MDNYISSSIYAPPVMMSHDLVISLTAVACCYFTLRPDSPRRIREPKPGRCKDTRGRQVHNIPDFKVLGVRLIAPFHKLEKDKAYCNVRDELRFNFVTLHCVTQGK